MRSERCWRLSREHHRAIIEQRIGVRNEALAKRLLHNDAAKARAVDKYVGLNPLANFEDQRGYIAIRRQRDFDDLAR